MKMMGELKFVIPHFLTSLKTFIRLLKPRSFVVSDEIPAERYFKIPHFDFERQQF